ncbi:ATP-binding protein [Pseudoteredinibacter isoporae]|uniref:ATP-binding protein n=1 Tax=Pseudoteredinibacter isoporae TaxID=570281 RepID=UPI003108024D
MSNDKFFVDVSPEMQLYKILQRQSYGVGTAIAEFIDNSIQAFIDKKKAITAIEGKDATLSIRISIDSNKNEIIIEDNASGINRADFQRAIKMGLDANLAHNDESLSVYGIGMKSSAIWFSNRWVIETSALGSNEKLIAEFDLNRLLETGDVRIPVNSEPQEINQHYTKIIIKDSLRKLKDQKSLFQDNVLPYLQETFFKFKFFSISMNYDGEVLNSDKAFLKLPKPLVYPPVDASSNPITSNDKEWKMKVDFTVNGKQVKGFIMIMETGGYHQPGIRLLRNNRVIVGTQGGGRQNRPPLLLKTANKYGAQRIYGELTLNDFRVNFMKTDFDDELNEVYDYLNVLLKGNGSGEDYFKQTNNFRKRKSKISPTPESPNDESSHDDSNDKNEAGFQQNNITPSNIAPNTNQYTEGVDSNINNGSDSESPKDDPPKGESVEINKSGNTRIASSDKIVEKLNQLGSNKLKSLYNSLCSTSLDSHPALSYVGAWSFIETLCSFYSHKSEQNYSGDFQAFFSKNRLSVWNIASSHGASIRAALKDIADIGNASKHDPVFYAGNARQLAINFETLEPTLLALMSDILE